MTETLVIYADFNCPYSALASARAAALEARGLATIDWRAVEHDADIPAAGVDHTDTRRAEVADELDTVRGLLVGAEPDVLRVPPRDVNTSEIIAAYAATPAGERAALRQRLYAAYWQDGADLGDPVVIERLVGTARDHDTAARWQSEWAAIPKSIVPTMVLPDGYKSRGLGALSRLAKLITPDATT